MRVQVLHLRREGLELLRPGCCIRLRGTRTPHTPPCPPPPPLRTAGAVRCCVRVCVRHGWRTVGARTVRGVDSHPNPRAPPKKNKSQAQTKNHPKNTNPLEVSTEWAKDRNRLGHKQFRPQ